MAKPSLSTAGEAMSEPHPDPIYAAIIRLRSAELALSQAVQRLSDVEDDHECDEAHPFVQAAKAKLDAADDAFMEAQLAFLRTVPTTILGVARAIEFAGEESFTDYGGTSPHYTVLESGFESITEEIRVAASAFLPMLAGTLRELDKLQRAGVL
jgi:hypothetical protein